MLINKNSFNTNDIVSMKLVNGDELVAKMVLETADSYLLSRPCTVIPSAQGMGLVQSMFTADVAKDISINKQHVMMAAPSIAAMEKHYLETTSGIALITR